jgi:hypothetical protein
MPTPPRPLTLAAAACAIALGWLADLPAPPAAADAGASATAPAPAMGVETSLGRNITFRFDDGRLSARWGGNPQSGNPSDRPVIRRPTAKLMVQMSGAMRLGRGGDMAFANITRQGTLGGPAGYYQLQVPKAGGALTITGQNLHTPDAGVYGLELTTDGNRIRVTVSRSSRGGAYRAVLKANVKDLRQLAADHPDEVWRFVAPALIELTGIDCFPLDAGDVYRAFDDIQPDPAVAAAVARLLPALDAESFAQRDRAARDLAALGPAGVLAALRLDRRGLTPAQRSALDGFIASRTLDPRRSVADARKDPEFLLKCLGYPDKAVRPAARDALEKLAGRKVTDGEAPVDTVALRGTLLGVIYPGVKVNPNPPDPGQGLAYGFGLMDEAARRDQIRIMRENEQQNLARWPMGKTYRRQELMEVRRVRGLPQVRWSKNVSVAAPTRIGVEGTAGSWLVLRAGEFRKGSTEVSLAWSDARRDDGPWKINLNLSNTYFSVSAQYGENAPFSNVTLTSSNNQVSVTAGRNTLGRPAIQVQADSFAALARLQPELVRQHVAPMLRELFGLYFAPPDPALAYAVFDELPADESVARRLEAIVPRLDVDAAAEREAAGEQLRGLGIPGVVAVLHYRRENLTFEQESRLNAFLADHTWRGDGPGDAQTKALRTDRSFLLACLEFQTPDVRTAAKRALEDLVGPVELDVNLPPDQLSSAVETLRLRLEASAGK